MYGDVETCSVFNYLGFFFKIRSSVNKVSWLLLIMSILEWDIRLSIFHSILFGLGLQARRFLRTSIMNVHKESFYVPAMRLSALWDHPKVLSSRDIAFFIRLFNLFFWCWSFSKTCTVSFRIHYFPLDLSHSWLTLVPQKMAVLYEAFCS